MTLSEVMEPSIAYARNGYPVVPRITATINTVHELFSTEWKTSADIYLPNGNPIETEKFDYKIKWMKKFNSYIQGLKNKNIPIIISGDFNVIPTDDDVYSPENFKNDACTHPLTREQYRILINMGFTDLVKHFVEGKTNWTFWGYRGGGWQKGNGLRIDHFLTTANVTDLVNNVAVNREPRGWEKASDHTPVTITLEN
mgnify:CR=1 FL=1